MILGVVEDWWNILVTNKENILLASQLQISDLSLDAAEERCFSWEKPHVIGLALGMTFGFRHQTYQC